MAERISLAHRKPLASGSARDVYAHPDDADLLIKVVRKTAIAKRYGKGRPWYKFTRRSKHFISYLREIREEIAIQASLDEHPLCIQKVIGFADTDLGFGLVVKAAKDRAGNIAPTLPSLIDNGRYDATARAALVTCLDGLVAAPVVLADVHGHNLVYAWDAEHGDHFVLIDGIGSKTLIPIHAMSRRINAYAKRKLADKVLARADAASAGSGKTEGTTTSQRLYAAE